MAILAQTKLSFGSHQRHYQITPVPSFRATQVHCSATTTTGTRKIELNQLATDQSLVSTWSHRAWVAAGSATVLISLAEAVAGSVDTHSWAGPALASWAGYLAADLGSGIYHWGIDNYGDATTPVFGTQIDAFQGHHRRPWTITQRQVANNLHALARAVTFVVLPLDVVMWAGGAHPAAHGFVGVCSGCIMLSQQFHAWAHAARGRLPPLAAALQDGGLLVSRKMHGVHHRPPYNNNYCIVSGIWNEFLDRQKVFEALEMVLFFKFGLRPRSWTEPDSNWTEDDDDAA